MQTAHSSPRSFQVKIKDSQVSNPRIAQWTPALVNHGVGFKTAPQESVAPNGLLGEGELHTFPFPKVEKHSDSQEEAVKKGFTICYTDGCPFYDKGITKTGYKAVMS